jgi:signal peptidase I
MLTASLARRNDIADSKTELSKLLVDEVLARGVCIRLKGRGGSMYPFVRTGDMLLIEPKIPSELKIGDLVLYRRESGVHIVHRLIRKNGLTSLITRGDGLFYDDPPVPVDQVLGRVIAVERDGRSRKLDSPLNKVFGRVWAKLSPMNRWLYYLLKPAWKIYRKFGLFIQKVKGLFGLGIRKLQGISTYRRAVKLLQIRVEIREADKEEGQQITGHAISPSIDKTIFVAKKGKNIVGYVEWAQRPAQEHPFKGHWLYGLTVRSIYRGSGIGEKLTQKVIEKSVSEGAKELSLLVAENNYPAVKLYRKLGFDRRIIPALEKLLEEEQHATGDRRICMVKSLK